MKKMFRVVCMYDGKLYMWKGYATSGAQAKAILTNYLKREFKLSRIFVIFTEVCEADSLRFEKGYIDVRGFKARKTTGQMNIYELMKGGE